MLPSQGFDQYITAFDASSIIVSIASLEEAIGVTSLVTKFRKQNQE